MKLDIRMVILLAMRKYRQEKESDLNTSETVKDVIRVFKNEITINKLIELEFRRKLELNDGGILKFNSNEKSDHLYFFFNIRELFYSQERDLRGEFMKFVSYFCSSVIELGAEDVIIDIFKSTRDLLILDKTLDLVTIPSCDEFEKLKKSVTLFYGIIYFIVTNISIIEDMISNKSSYAEVPVEKE